jgi:hypothetical protein
MRFWVAALLAITPVQPAELAAYCKGFCQGRYQDGAFSDGKCACIDYFPLERSELIDLPKRHRDPKSSRVYNGVDDLHYAPAEDSGS